MNNKFEEGPRIYNLFPKLLGPIHKWIEQIPRIKRMNFNWIYTNSFHYPGFSGSIYSIKHFFILNPLFLDNHTHLSHEEQIENFVNRAHNSKIKVLMDLLISQMAIDNPLVEEHPDWFVRDEAGRFLSPGRWNGNKWESWGDLVIVDNENSDDKRNLWKYWINLAQYYIRIGFDGFRVPAAHIVPCQLWDLLIKQCKIINPDVKFFGDSLGADINKTVELAKSGFDYLFNSSKYWDFYAPWCLNQYSAIAPLCDTISFPESYETSRLAEDTNDNWQLVKQRYLFAAFFSTGISMPIGFEFGFHKNLDPVHQKPTDFEQVRIDLTGFVREVNAMKNKYQIFNEDGLINRVAHDFYQEIIALIKVSNSNDMESILILNTNDEEPRTISLGDFTCFLQSDEKIKDITPENRINGNKLNHIDEIEIPPSGYKLFISFIE